MRSHTLTNNPSLATGDVLQQKCASRTRNNNIWQPGLLHRANSINRLRSLHQLDTATTGSFSPGFQHDFSHVHTYASEKTGRDSPQFTSTVSIHPQPIRLNSTDPIHAPLLNQYRQLTNQPSGGVDPISGQQVAPSDAELKYSGVLGIAGSATWLNPIINRHNPVGVYLASTPLIGNNTFGLTTQFINGREVHSNQDVEAAIPSPTVQTRQEGNQTVGWFQRGVNVTGHTTMDILTPPPWEMTISAERAAEKYQGTPRCQGRSGDTTIRVHGRPTDQALETFVKLGEAEHDADSAQAFHNNIREYAANVARLVGDTPFTRVRGANPVDCHARLAQLENRDLLTQFVIDLNAATDGRHVRQRHSVSTTGVTINTDCSQVNVEIMSGTL